MKSTKWPCLLAVILISGGAGVRYGLLDHGTVDTVRYLLPWYNHARDYGLASLGHHFTNYTPFYTYLLLAATGFDGLADPLSLIKGISALFEAGCAVVVAFIVYAATNSLGRSVMALGVAWAAPMVIFNGAAWAQADSIWAFFTLISVRLFMRGRDGTLPFALAFAVKAQGVFLGPFVLGNLLRMPSGPWRLVIVPAVYGALAIPVLIAGLNLMTVLSVYLDQAVFFRRLSMNAGNLWALFPGFPYTPGVALGLLFGVLGGVWLAYIVARRRNNDPLVILLAACLSLLLMPFLLPKMHERYFYAFELASLSLAFVDRRYILFALFAQVNGLISYAPFEMRLSDSELPAIAAVINGVMACSLAWDLRERSRRGSDGAGGKQASDAEAQGAQKPRVMPCPFVFLL